MNRTNRRNTRHSPLLLPIARSLTLSESHLNFQTTSEEQLSNHLSLAKTVVNPIDLQLVPPFVDTNITYRRSDLLYRDQKRCRKTFDLNIVGGSHQWTALHLAGHASHISVVMQLVAAGMAM